METFLPGPSDRVLDIGATSDDRFTSSNYFEALYPWKSRIVATGIDEGASFLEDRYPGLTFATGDACELPFADDEFEFAHSSAVLEHVGSRDRQARMVSEAARVARRGVWLTTPNRWFPVELHTQIPLIHWLPPRHFRRILGRLGQHELALEENLNLMSESDVRAACDQIERWSFSVEKYRLMGLASNLLLVGRSG
jgi:ubiquinone/menaquinone biosynthesis C-methylase UbiE